MSLRFLVLIFAAAGCAHSQSFPAFRWIQQVDGSASDSVIGVAADSAGNTYIAGNTMSVDFPVKSAPQSHRGSSGLYRVDGPGPAWVALPLSSAVSIAPVSGNPNVLYAASAQGAALKSTDGGQTWSTLSIPGAVVRTIAVDPSNPNTLYVGTSGQGAFKSIDGGQTWTAINAGLAPSSNSTQIFVAQFWIDPNHPNVVFANSGGNNGAVISTNGGASWTDVPNLTGLPNIWFDLTTSGLIYAANGSNVFKSADDGQTWTMLAAIPPSPMTGAPGSIFSITSDPNQAGRLIVGTSAGGIFVSTNDGASWTQGSSEQPLNYPGLTADWANGALYGSTGTQGIVKITTNLQSVSSIGPPSAASANQIAVANGHVYVASGGSNAVFVTKLDSSGNIVYSTLMGGTGNDSAYAMAVDPAGNVYVAGLTTSTDFPTTAGSYSPSVPAGGVQNWSFVLKLKPDSTVAYSTYLSNSDSVPGGIALDGSGDAFITGTSQGELPTTAGSFQPNFSGMVECAFALPSPRLCFFPTDAFLTKLDPAGATLVFSTYIGSGSSASGAIAVGPDGSSFLGGGNGGMPGVANNTLYHMNATGGSMLGTASAAGAISAISVGPDGNVYVAGQFPISGTFQATPGAFESAPVPAPVLEYQNNGPYAFITKYGPNFNVLASTLLGGDYGDQINGLAFDAAGNVLAAGSTEGFGFPTRTPLVNAFAFNTGFASKLTPDLSTLLFSTYLGDAQTFSVTGIAPTPDGDFVVAGNAGSLNGNNPTQVFVNKIGPGGATATAALPFRIDAVLNAASLLDTALSAGETIVIQGAGFSSSAQLLINGAAAPLLSVSAQSITAVIPPGFTATAAVVQVESGGALSNAIAAPAAPAAPGLFSADGSGIGQGYILNDDGTLNTPANPAKPGSQITVFATGIGPLSFSGSFAVAQYLPAVFVDGFYLDGVAATVGSVPGLPGQVYQLTVTLPTLASVSTNFGLQNFAFPAQSSVVLQSNSVSSQLGLAVSIAQN